MKPSRHDQKTYQAVMVLRRLGFSVYRAGRNHSLVNRQRVHNARLRSLWKTPAKGQP